jgi:NAD(P)-dependent dehydrogenase (short-subunit alcohol dehydrogenase family)|tara:strand:+ start:1785 stop:2576 length:792 start_codon:yes stop_codon:yes gene_type:complete
MESKKMENNPLFNLKGKTAIITGSSRGIGKAIAIRMAQYGAKVMISSRKIDACNQVVDEIKALGGEAFAQECNIASKEALQNLCDVSYKKLGKVDILVLNAASNPYYGPLAKITDEAFDKVMNNNVKSNLWLSNMVLPKMAETGGGKAIVISSIAGIKGSDVLGAYSISKTADLGLVRSLAVEWGPKNITVNALCPGIIKTDFAKALWDNPEILESVEKNAPLKRIGTPDEVAGAAILLASSSGGFITGQKIVMDGGVTIGGI